MQPSRPLAFVAAYQSSDVATVHQAWSSSYRYLTLQITDNSLHPPPTLLSYQTTQNKTNRCLLTSNALKVYSCLKQSSLNSPYFFFRRCSIFLIAVFYLNPGIHPSAPAAHPCLRACSLYLSFLTSGFSSLSAHSHLYAILCAVVVSVYGQEVIYIPNQT